MITTTGHEIVVTDGEVHMSLVDSLGQRKAMDFSNGFARFQGSTAGFIAAIRAFIRDPNRPVIQQALPFLNADEREFIMTGLTPAEWDELFNPDTANDTAPPF